MASRTPPLQERSRFHSHWGSYASNSLLPNASGASLPSEQFVLEAGDVAFVSGEGLYTCTSAGTAGGADATWVYSGGMSPVPYMEGFAVGNCYTLASNPLAGVAEWCLAFMFEQKQQRAGSIRSIVSVEDQFLSQGAGIVTDGQTITARVWDASGALRQLPADLTPVTIKWIVGLLQYIPVGGDTELQLFVNGSQVASQYLSAVSGPITGGVPLTVGAQDGGTVRPADIDRIQGTGYATRAPFNDEIGDWTERCIQAGRLVDLPTGGSFSAAWRIDGSDPGATWAPFAGAGNLTRVGAALTVGTNRYPLYK